MFNLVLHAEPVFPVVTHVVTTQRQHGHWVTTNSRLILGSSSSFRAKSRSHINAMSPILALVYQRECSTQTTTKQERTDGNAFRIFPFRVHAGTLIRRRCKAGIGM